MAVLALIAGFIMYSMTSVPSQSLATAMDQNSTVTFNDGKTVVGTFGSVHRQLLTYNQIPKVVDDAVMSAEDRGFMTEGAIDPQGMLRAAYDDLISGGGSLSGGSTITQQFVRNYYDDIGTSQTATRKVKEIFVAMKVAKEKSKQWILANYLNTIYLGQDAYGVAAAAQTYFGVPVNKLTTAQAAVIAAIIQQPSLFPQPQYRPQLENRWHYVLSGMVKMGDLTAAQAATMKFPAMLPLGHQYTGDKPWDAYIMQEVRGELTGVDHITQHQLDTGGLKIKLTINPQSEQKLYDAVNTNIAAIRASGYTLPPYALIGAEAENPTNGGIEAVYPGPGMDAPPNQCNATCQLNTTLTSEQVGSSFKPYVLSAAVQQGMNVQTSILNANPTLWVPPFSMAMTPSSSTKQPPPYYQVNNDKNEKIPGALSNGGSTVQNALAQSSNTAFTDLAHRIGLQPIEQMAEAEGGVDPKTFAYTPGVGIALGINSLTVNDQASMMATIDDGGVYHQGHMVQSITGSASSGPIQQPAVVSHIALTPGEASQVQYALEKTVVNGTAPAARMADGRPIIGKTGTTTGSKSAFFIGGIPQDVLAVGIFTEHQGNNNTETLTALGGGGFGGTWPAAIWHSYAESMWASMPIQNFLSPQFSGSAWLQLPKPPPPPKPKPKPSPSQSNNGNQNGGWPFGGGPSPSNTPSPGQNCGLFGCNSSNGGNSSNSASSSAATPTPSAGGPGGGGPHG